MSNLNKETMLHPELMQPSALLNILLERRIKIDGLETMNASELIQVYNQFCLPQTQRKYRETIRGKLLSKQQEEKDKQNKNMPKMPNKMCSNLMKTESGKYANNNGSSNMPESGDQIKRKLDQNYSNEPESQPLSKKHRTKITWP